MRKLRSQAWFGGRDKDGFVHRSWMKNNGLPEDAFDGRPVIGICNTFSELTPCNAHFRDIAAKVKAGVLEAGGLPLEFPVFSCGESNLRPTAMLFRNLASIDVEEAIRANPVDGLTSWAHAQELLVVGRHAQHGKIAGPLGSVSLGVLHHATCPIAVVPPTEGAPS